MFFFSSRRRHTRCALVTGVQTCALPIFMRRGASFDAGLMQINSANFARLGLTPETVFDPCTNLRAGAHVLTDNYRRASDAGRADPLRAALSEYNSGSRTRGLTNGYVGRDYAAAKGTGADPGSSEKRKEEQTAELQQ